MSCEKCKQNTILVVCSQCQAQSCPHGIIRDHLEQHPELVHIICQQCEQNEAQKYCENCEQHLCNDCSEKIHNKAKRAQHIVKLLSESTFRIREVYMFCYDTFGGRQAMLQQIICQTIGGQEFKDKLIVIEGSDIPSSKKFTIISFKSSKFNSEQISTILNCYPFIDKLNAIESPMSKKLFDNINIKQFPGEFRYHKTAPISKDNSNDSVRVNSSINQSNSTDNSLRKRGRKSPILYFQPWLSSKTDRRRFIQEKYRNLVQKGTLMIRRDSEKYQEESITRTFSRNIGEVEVDYISMQLDTISIQCLSWIIRSIKVDRMTPSEKLVLSRLKQSFDFKVSSKLWQQIIKYLDSNAYAQDRMEKDPSCIIPYILVQLEGEQTNLVFKNEEWSYEDQGVVVDTSLEWKQFVELLNDYFSTNSQIGGGRYGCVQYVKLRSNKPLKDCSLGRLSLFVQQAINRGIIRYHKTLLVSNADSQSFINNNSLQSDVKLMQIHRDVKVITIQIKLMEMFLDCGQGMAISLAQIPLNLKKKVFFDVNIVELGFPKLKNLLGTLSDKLQLETTKSHVSYQTHAKTLQMFEELKANLFHLSNALLSSIINIIEEICNYSPNIILEELYNQLNNNIGFIFDFRIFNIPDFYQFVVYYCHQIVQIQLISGLFVVNSRSSSKYYQHDNPESSTPKFNTSIQYQVKATQTLKWQSYENILHQFVSEQEPEYAEQDQHDQSESYSDYRCIEKVLEEDDDSKSNSHRTIIEKPGLNLPNEDIAFSSIDGRSDYDGKSFGVYEQAIMNEQMNFVGYSNPRSKAHYRVNSNTPKACKTNHNRVFSNFTKN